ncbi:ABC-type spermidine/putrescine transport system,ATPase component [Halanaeroarchaeum sp. HSR-CO]|uniref:ABC transporter ATP-binding protein n=1 Tax=Halanaeroarchaeum sp. HSR-CO TaxID=2866382 RepID=UPI00217EEEB1|nr:ABC transporter ATP-binding protein [Halanaeroarchaeum sp. HSR-CO]UWG49134.1 ABC-type spermidine/putrescine transport system,ATPase component [Halanaeroarchaeum sp. HSR-CO]
MTDIQLTGVDKRFDDTIALEDVTLHVRDGEFFTLVGPSGCGKTTTLRIVAGLEEPTGGTVAFGGEDVAGRPTEDRDVGIVFQSYALFPHMTVAENVAYGLRFRDPPDGQDVEERVADLLDLVDLGGMEERDPGELSGGQQQRIALARALAPGPDVLLLDEPMSALDARLRDRLRRQIREIQQALDITTLYVTHDQAEALAISDRIAVLNGGRVEQVGTPESVYREPESRFVAEFVGDNNLFDVESVHTSNGEPRALVDGTAIAAPEGVRSGDVLSVRPETMQFGDGETTLPVTVETVEFLGDAYKSYCRWEGRPLVVKTNGPPSGAETTVGFDVADVHLVREER